MSKLTDVIKDVADSAEDLVEDVAGGIWDPIEQAGGHIGEGLESAGRKLRNAFVPQFPTAEEIASAIPEPLKRGAVQSAVAQYAPTVDLGATESSRRSSGQAFGNRKLTLPLGGLR